MRLGDAGASNVTAVLKDAQPYAFTVTAGQTTAIVLHDAASNVGDLTFSPGTTTTTLQVDAGTALPTRGVISGTFALADDTLTGPAALNAAVTTAQPLSVPLSVAFKITGPFTVGYAANDSLCAPISATYAVAIVADAGVAQNIEALVQEASGGAGGAMCLYDAMSTSAVGPRGIQVSISRLGTAATPQIAAALAAPDAGAPQFLFALSFDAQLPTALYNGVTAAFSTFNQPFSDDPRPPPRRRRFRLEGGVSKAGRRSRACKGRTHTSSPSVSKAHRVPKYRPGRGHPVSRRLGAGSVNLRALSTALVVQLKG